MTQGKFKYPQKLYYSFAFLIISAPILFSVYLIVRTTTGFAQLFQDN